MGKIIVVDDEQNLLVHVVGRLESLGHRAEGLSEPQFLFPMLESFAADLILLDINMPNIDGITLLKQLKDHPAYSLIPVIMLTGEDTPQTLEECFNLGCRDFIGKPIQPAVFRARITAVLTRVRMEKQIQQNQKMEALSALSRGIAHDFNNILFSILGFSELLQSHIEEDYQAIRYLQNIIQSSNRAKNVVSQLLTFSEMDKNAPLLPMQLLTTLKSVLIMLRSSLPENVSVHTHLGQEYPNIEGSGKQLYQVLINLCINAQESMEQHGGTLAISLESICVDSQTSSLYAEIPPGNYQRVIISDTGCGMTPEVKTRVFEPFYTQKGLGGTTAGAPKEGTGLGLYVVQNIVKRHQGYITLESQEGKGSSFYLYFPELDPEVKYIIPEYVEELPQRLRFIDPPEEEEEEVKEKLRILIAEDELLVGELYMELLSMEGYEVTLCANGLEALEVFQKEPKAFDLLLTDQEMPEMTGTQLCTEILKIRSELPIVLITGFSAEVSKENYADFGIHAFLNKPVNHVALMNALDGLFE